MFFFTGQNKPPPGTKVPDTYIKAIDDLSGIGLHIKKEESHYPLIGFACALLWAGYLFLLLD